MKAYVRLFIGIVFMASFLLTGCSDDNSSSPTTVASNGGTGSIEGQLVADAGTQFAKRSSASSQHAADEDPETVYPLSGVTVELLQSGTVIATTTTDEYGRFQFTDLASGDYEVRVVSGDDAVAYYHVYVNADQTITVYGRVMPEDWMWYEEPGPHWDEMPYGSHWGGGFCGASPGSGYWYDGQEWWGPHHGPHHRLHWD